MSYLTIVKCFFVFIIFSKLMFDLFKGSKLRGIAKSVIILIYPIVLLFFSYIAALQDFLLFYLAAGLFAVLI